MKTVHAAIDVFDAINSGRKHRCLPSDWSPSFAPYVVSAVANKQWPQARCASVKSAEWTKETKCRLCNDHHGTLLHRHSGNTLWPSPLPPPQLRHSHPAITFSAAQNELWMTRGIGAARVFVQQRDKDETFH